MKTVHLASDPVAGRLLAVGRHPLTGRIASRLRDRCDVTAGSRIVVGVSGGADSVALLLACCAIRARKGPGGSYTVDPVCCHVNHRLRDDAEEDERFVIELCSALDVPCAAEHIDVAAESGNVSDAARRLRYAALARVAQAHHAAAVAVAHHADDQFETMLMNLCRGSGLDGLGGMTWRTPNENGLEVVRPLLDSHRSECSSLCVAASVAWREDPTNADVTYARARLRQDVIPVLESLWPGAAKRATLPAELLEYAARRLETDVAAVFGDAAIRSWPRASLRSASSTLIAAGLRRAALSVDPAVADRLTQSHLIEAADAICDHDRRPRTYHWPCGLTLHVTSDKVSL